MESHSDPEQLIEQARAHEQAGQTSLAGPLWVAAARWCADNNDPRAEGLAFKAGESEPRRCYWTDLRKTPPNYEPLPCPDRQTVLSLAELMESVFFDRADWVQWYLEYQPLLECSAVVRERGKVVGACLIDAEAERGATVAVVLVENLQRRRGLGARLLGSCLSRLATVGRHGVLAHIHPANMASRRTFEGCGFRPIESLEEMLRFAECSGFVRRRDLEPLVAKGDWEQSLAGCAERGIQVL